MSEQNNVPRNNDNFLRLMDAILNGGPDTVSMDVPGISDKVREKHPGASGLLHGDGNAMKSLTMDDAKMLLTVAHSTEQPHSIMMDKMVSLLNDAATVDTMPALSDKSGHIINAQKEVLAGKLKDLQQDARAAVAVLNNSTISQLDHEGKPVEQRDINPALDKQLSDRAAAADEQKWEQKAAEEKPAIDASLKLLKQKTGVDWHYDNNMGFFTGDSERPEKVAAAKEKLSPILEAAKSRSDNPDAYALNKDGEGLVIGSGSFMGPHLEPKELLNALKNTPAATAQQTVSPAATQALTTTSAVNIANRFNEVENKTGLHFYGSGDGQVFAEISPEQLQNLKTIAKEHRDLAKGMLGDIDMKNISATDGKIYLTLINPEKATSEAIHGFQERAGVIGNAFSGNFSEAERELKNIQETMPVINKSQSRGEHHDIHPAAHAELDQARSYHEGRGTSQSGVATQQERGGRA